MVMLKIGSIKSDVPFFQAAMAGYSDRAMRALARQFGCPLIFSGVLIDKSAAMPKLHNIRSKRIGQDEHPIGGQIMGSDPATMAKAARVMVEAGYDLIDLNFACPVPKVLRRGRAGALLLKPQLAIDIFRTVRDELKDFPLTIKIRKGYNESDESREYFWQIIETVAANGVDAITIHGRTVLKKYHGPADWDIITQAKRKLPNTTIIGSGDIFDPAESINKMKTSGADGIIVARGAVGNPWIFENLRAVLENRPVRRPDVSEQGRIIRQHFTSINEVYDLRKSVRYFRKFLAQYARLHPEHKKVKRQLMAAQNEMELKEAITEWYGTV